jgi:hypothetical protein
VIDLLVDIVSRNGNLLLNFPLPNSGELDYEELVILDEITKWMAINSEGICATRPWKVFGDGPVATAPPSSGGTRFNESRPEGAYGRRSSLYDQGRYALCVHYGLAGEGSLDQAAGYYQQSLSAQDQECRAVGLQKQSEMESRRTAPDRSYAGTEAL